MVEQLPPSVANKPGGRISVNGDVALVTGGGSGIGRMTAFTLAAAGADIAVVDRITEKADTVSETIQEEFEVNSISVSADVSDEGDVEQMIDTVTADLDTLDILVNVAGTSRISSTADLSLEEWNFIFDVNLNSVFLNSKYAYPELADGGRIVNTASVAGLYGSAVMSHYASAKQAIMNFTRSLAREWESENIRVNAVAPAPILTAGAEEYMSADEEAHNRARIGRTAGSPPEVADTILFLSSQLSSYISGETLTVGGAPPVQEDIWG